MKSILLPFAGAVILSGLIACGGTDNENETDSLSMSTTTTTDATTTEGSANTTRYVDVYTGSQVNITKDEQTGKYINAETRVPVEYYYDPATNDTFDTQGRVVNMALIRSTDGKYTVDESKVKIQSDGDLKMKSADGETKVKLETDGDGKIKYEDGSKVKVRDGEVKVKE